MATHQEIMELGESVISECFAADHPLQHTTDCAITLNPGSTICSCGLSAMWNQLVMTAGTLAMTYGTGQPISTGVVQRL